MESKTPPRKDSGDHLLQDLIVFALMAGGIGFCIWHYITHVGRF